MSKKIRRLLCAAMSLCLLLSAAPAAFASEEAASGEAAETEAAVESMEAPAGYYFVQMNIPYADFYDAELTGNDVEVDAVSSATMSKTKSGNLVAGSYHVDPEGSDITGISYTVAVPEDADLSAYLQVTEEDSVEITATNRGEETTTEYTGKDALFQNESYAYYVLTEEDTVTAYKTLTVEEDGSLSFGPAVAAVTETLEDATATITTDTQYGDLQINVESETLTSNASTVYAVVLRTAEGESYGLRHLENVWRTTQLAWSVGFTTTAHGNTLSYDHYVDIMGQTVTSIVYYTEDGIFTIETELEVPVVTAETASASGEASGEASQG